MTKQLYHLANIRELLTQGFDDRELRRLCYDVPDFRPVYDELARTTGKGDIIDALLEYAERHLLIDTLLALAKEQNPARYELHGPYYLEDPTPALQRQVSDLAKRLAVLTAPSTLSREQQYQLAYHWQELGARDSLRGFDLREADLRAANLVGADLRFASLTLAKLNVADIRKADLRGADLSGADLSGADLRATNLRGANLARARLLGSILDEYTQIKEKWRLVWELVNQGKAEHNLIRADLDDADLGGADLRAVDLYGADLRGTNLRGTNLSGAKLYGANLCEADLSETKLIGANLISADLRRAGLCRANLHGAMLGKANLSEADLTEADLTEATVTEEQLSLAASIEGAIMPDGTVRE
jgi:uncharacterized protein YjbI with pentapeptide repeats